MASQRRRHALEIKAKVAMEVAEGEKTQSQLRPENGDAAEPISQWETSVDGRDVRGYGRQQQVGDRETLTAPLHQEIGRLKIELDRLKKSGLLSVEEKRRSIEPSYPT